MAKISDIDKNLAEKAIIRDGMRFINILKDENFTVYGLLNTEEGDYKRLPHDIAPKVNDGVKRLYRHTSGGRVRFKTDSRKITLRCNMPEVTNFPHMPMTGTGGFDIFADGEYFKSFIPPLAEGEKFCLYEDGSRGFESSVEFSDSKIRDIIINFPLYNSVDEIFIGIDENTQLLKGNEYKYKTPIVYYGSSITHGGCASRPGNAYPAMISRWLDTDFINLGFSGSCRAESVMAEYIGNINMSVFVYDYDHNAHSAGYLRETHERFFKEFRLKQPLTPVIMISAADKAFGDSIAERKEIIYTTYKNAVENGDKNVYFIDGQTIYAEPGYDLCTVDGCHPNDLGFYFMGKKISEVIEKLL